MDQQLLGKLWNEAWESGLWAASWRRSVVDLTAAQAAWRPDPQRHSIWQIVEHLIYWREVTLRRAAGGEGPSDAEAAPRNFPQPAEPTDAAWADTVKRLGDSQQAIAALLAEPQADISRVPYLLAHDAYHMGQISYLRALQGLPPLE